MERTYITDTIELKKLMVERQFNTIGALASASDVNRNTLGKILDGSIQPSSDIMKKLVIALNMTPEKAGAVFFALALRSA